MLLLVLLRDSSCAKLNFSFVNRAHAKILARITTVKITTALKVTELIVAKSLAIVSVAVYGTKYTA